MPAYIVTPNSAMNGVDAPEWIWRIDRERYPSVFDVLKLGYDKLMDLRPIVKPLAEGEDIDDDGLYLIDAPNAHRLADPDSYHPFSDPLFWANFVLVGCD